jgi:hypothetical protein
MSPVRSDDPLRRVTLNLYEADCQEIERDFGAGWTTWIRNVIHAELNRTRRKSDTRLTLGDLNDILD